MASTHPLIAVLARPRGSDSDSGAGNKRGLFLVSRSEKQVRSIRNLSPFCLAIFVLCEPHEGGGNASFEYWLPFAFPISPKLPFDLAHV